MKHIWFQGVALSLGLMASAGYAADDGWRVAPPTAAPKTPVVTLGCPIPLAASPTAAPLVDPKIRPTSYESQTIDPPTPRPLPVDAPPLPGASATATTNTRTSTEPYLVPVPASQPKTVPQGDTLWWRFTHLIGDDGDDSPVVLGDDCGSGCCDTGCAIPN